jgi:hypothetical protein
MNPEIESAARAVEGDARLAIWLRYRLADPKFDDPGSLMVLQAGPVQGDDLDALLSNLRDLD